MYGREFNVNSYKPIYEVTLDKDGDKVYVRTNKKMSTVKLDNFHEAGHSLNYVLEWKSFEYELDEPGPSGRMVIAHYKRK